MTYEIEIPSDHQEPGQTNAKPVGKRLRSIERLIYDIKPEIGMEGSPIYY